MTEAEWLEIDGERRLLKFLRGKSTERKFRLFACGCWRNWQLIQSFPAALQLLDAMERHADGAPFPDELVPPQLNSIDDQVLRIRSRQAHYAAGLASKMVGYFKNVGILRCIFGNPFRPVAFADSWRSETVVALASGIYAEWAFDRLHILADALEEAGCDHPDILAHCRGPGPHVRGCWVVDLVLGKS
jgi:hypothetical protein